MTDPPRDPSSSLLGRADWTRALANGATLAVAVMATYLAALHAGLSGDGRPIWRVPIAGNLAVLPVVLGTIGSLALAAAAGCISVLWMQPLLALRPRL